MRAFFIGILAVALGLVGLGLFMTRSPLSGANESPVAASARSLPLYSTTRHPPSPSPSPSSTQVAQLQDHRKDAERPPLPRMRDVARVDTKAPQPQAPAPAEEERSASAGPAPRPMAKQKARRAKPRPLRERAPKREEARISVRAVEPTDRLSGLLKDDKRRARGEVGELGYRDARRMPAAIDLGLLSTGAKTARIDAPRPERFLPRMCYFENTYLGGNAAYQEQLRRVQTALGHTRPLRLTRLDAQAFDAPLDAGMALTASLDTTGLQQPGRVVLQVGLQGSQRYGWRRPPLDVVLVIDGPAAHATRPAIDALLGALGPRDRLGVIRAGEAPLTAVAGMRAARDALLDVPAYPGGGGSTALQTAMDRAGRLLRTAAGQSARIPGSQTVILLTQGQQDHARRATQAAHALQTQGAVVSVIDLSSDAQAEWWAVANAGHGNFHRTPLADLNTAVDAELASLAKVVARLLRVNVRLGPQAEGIRVIGSRVLEQAEVKAVKAREEATDRNLSKTMGLKADRGADDDGIQTVIPYFYGGDSHVVLIELWVDPAKASPETAVAEITLKYKDMVNLSNATARAAVFMDRRPKALTQAQRQVKQNLAGFAFADALAQAAQQMARGDADGMITTLRNHANTARDRQVVRAFERLAHSDRHAVAQALRLASQRRKGVSVEGE